MAKQRITLSLDADVVEALREFSDGKVSAFANLLLREGVERTAHHSALADWIEELNQKYGAPSPEQRAEARAFLDSLRDDDRASGAA